MRKIFASKSIQPNVCTVEVMCKLPSSFSVAQSSSKDIPHFKIEFLRPVAGTINSEDNVRFFERIFTTSSDTNVPEVKIDHLFSQNFNTVRTKVFCRSRPVTLNSWTLSKTVHVAFTRKFHTKYTAISSTIAASANELLCVALHFWVPFSRLQTFPLTFGALLDSIMCTDQAFLDPLENCFQSTFRWARSSRSFVQLRVETFYVVVGLGDEIVIILMLLPGGPILLVLPQKLKLGCSDNFGFLTEKFLGFYDLPKKFLGFPNLTKNFLPLSDLDLGKKSPLCWSCLLRNLDGTVTYIDIRLSFPPNISPPAPKFGQMRICMPDQKVPQIDLSYLYVYCNYPMSLSFHRHAWMESYDEFSGVIYWIDIWSYVSNSPDSGRHNMSASWHMTANCMWLHYIDIRTWHMTE